MPKSKQLTHRFTVRVPEFLANEIHKFTLDADIDYSVLFRLALSKYLKEKQIKKDRENTSMSAAKDDYFDVPSSSLFGVTSSYDEDIGGDWSGDSDNIGLN